MSVGHSQRYLQEPDHDGRIYKTKKLFPVSSLKILHKMTNNQQSLINVLKFLSCVR